MRSVAFLVPGRLETRTGGYIYDRRMIEELGKQGWSVDVHALDGSFPRPTPAALRHAADLFATIPADTCVLVDGLALSAMPDVIERETVRLRIAALVHLPLAANVGLDPDVAAGLADAEQRALLAASLVIVTGTATLALLADYRLPHDRIVVVEPGTTRPPLVRKEAGTALRLLSVATIQAGKGHELLVTALARLTHHRWELTCAGSLTRDTVTADRVRRMVRERGLERQVSFVGELDEDRMRRCYDRADVFVLATLQETYGMAIAEALAHGLPVVATTTGAIPQLVGTDAGLLVPPGNVAALTDTLDRILGDARLRARLAEGAARAAASLPSWEQSARRLSDALGAFERHG